MWRPASPRSCAFWNTGSACATADATVSSRGRAPRSALAGGAQACASAASGLRVGAPADLVVLDGAHPFIAAAAEIGDGDALLDRWLFAAADVVRDVLVGGRFAVRERRHAADEAIDAAFLTTLRRLQ